MSLDSTFSFANFPGNMLISDDQLMGFLKNGLRIPFFEFFLLRAFGTNFVENRKNYSREKQLVKISFR